MTINAPPQWWALLLNTEKNQQGNFESCRADKVRVPIEDLAKVAENMGRGEFTSVYGKVSYHASDPLVQDMLDSWKGKLSLTINLTGEPDAASATQVGRNIEQAASDWTNRYVLKPRGGKFLSR